MDNLRNQENEISTADLSIAPQECASEPLIPTAPDTVGVEAGEHSDTQDTEGQSGGASTVKEVLKDLSFAPAYLLSIITAWLAGFNALALLFLIFVPWGYVKLFAFLCYCGLSFISFISAVISGIVSYITKYLSGADIDWLNTAVSGAVLYAVADVCVAALYFTITSLLV